MDLARKDMTVQGITVVAPQPSAPPQTGLILATSERGATEILKLFTRVYVKSS